MERWCPFLMFLYRKKSQRTASPQSLLYKEYFEEKWPWLILGGSKFFSSSIFSIQFLTEWTSPVRVTHFSKSTQEEVLKVKPLQSFDAQGKTRRVRHRVFVVVGDGDCVVGFREKNDKWGSSCFCGECKRIKKRRTVLKGSWKLFKCWNNPSTSDRCQSVSKVVVSKCVLNKRLMDPEFGHIPWCRTLASNLTQLSKNFLQMREFVIAKW